MKSALILTGLALLPPAAVAAESHCSTGEQVVFSCSVGKKLVSVCASGSGPATMLQYRFGPRGAPELRYPEPAATAGKVATGGTLMFSGGGGAWLRFGRGDTAYVVYTGIGKGWEQEGVAVEKKGKLVASLTCKNAANSEIGPDFFEKTGIRDGGQDFEIP